MFIGKYYHKLESNRRLSLPKSFRDGHSAWVITRGLDGSLFLYTAEDFETEIANFEARTFTKKTNRDFIRLMTNEAQMLQVDRSGRVQLPEYLANLAGLNKEVVVVGSLKRIEIWDQQRYHAYVDTIESQAEEIAERLEEDKDE
jgi:MraZ protein